MPILDPELAAGLECRLLTRGRSSGEWREIRIWFAAAGDTLYLLAQNREAAHWVRNVQADPGVVVRLGKPLRTFEASARLVEGTPEDPIARDAFAAKYGTKYLAKFLREALPVAIDLQREVQ